jgi:uncharacterized protein YbjT (DUF2867 family)
MTNTLSSSRTDRRAVVLGGTGLVGSELVRQLLDHPGYEQVRLLLRKPSGESHPRREELVIDFEKPNIWADLITGDVLFSCLGTTMAVAKTKAAQSRVDHDYQLWAAQAAAKNGVARYVLVSSTGANPSSLAFYSRIKGKLEQEVSRLNFERCVLVRPSILDGARQEHRPAERLALEVLRHAPDWLLPESARPSKVPLVAQACILADLEGRAGVNIIDALRSAD